MGGAVRHRSEVEPKPTIALIASELGIELCTRSRRTNGNTAFQHQCGSLHVVGCNESRDVSASERFALMINTPDGNVCLILF